MEICFSLTGFESTVDILIENNANVDGQTIDRVAAIHLASEKGD